MTQKSLRILTVLTVFCVALLTAGCKLKLSGGNSKKTERERKIQQVLKDELKNRHGLTEGEDYTLKKHDPELLEGPNDDVYIYVGGSEYFCCYTAVDAELVSADKWRSEYYSISFRREVDQYINEVVAGCGLFEGDEYSVSINWENTFIYKDGEEYSIKTGGYLTIPIWVNGEEMQQLHAKNADKRRWSSTHVIDRDLVVTVNVRGKKDLAEDDFLRFREDLFFVKKLIVTDSSKTYSYYPLTNTFKAE